MLVNILGYIHKLVKKIHHISNIWVSNYQVNELPKKATISVDISKQRESRVPKNRFIVDGG